VIEFTDFHLYSGLGGAASGFQRARIEMEGVEARFRCLGGIDFDRAACADFKRLTGVPATLLDLFDREQHEAFHGKPPGPDWREAGPDDIRRAAGGEAPDVLFSSPPCKGFSALLSGSKAASARYQALNRLTLRGLWLALEAFKDQPPKIILLENVPLIQTRGRRFLDQIVATLRDAGYAVAETVHDCGEIGGLAQTRKRFLLVARHMRQVPPFLYQPHKRPLRGVGEVLGRLPLPGDPYGGPMHAIRRLHWMTWVRLALIPAGKDWRALQGLRVGEDGMLEDFSIEPLGTWFRGALGVAEWSAPSGCVTGDARPGKGPFAVADPRAAGWGGRGSYRVTHPDEPVGTVIAASSTGGGAFAVADPRPPYDGEYGQLGVREWGQPAGTVTGQGSPGQGPISIADPRFAWHPDAHRMKYRVAGWDRPATTVIAKSGHPASGGLSVADPRTGLGPGTHSNVYRITGFAQPAPVITSAGRPAAGGGTVADPRARAGVPFFNVYRVIDWTERATAVTGTGGPGGGVAVADPRLEVEVRAGSLGVRDWLQHVGTVAGQTLPSNGAYALADPRLGWQRKPGDRDGWANGGHLGVLPYESPAGTVSASASHDNGFFSVADPRLPAPTERVEAVIIAPDRTWHRPFTTLELAALQGLVAPEELWGEDGEPWRLDGASDTAWRERIGNAVPRDAAEGIGSTVLRVLLGSHLGMTFMLSATDVWVTPVAIGLSFQPEEGILI
jgi:site-specific DNA-cytosine methylase